MIGEYPTNRLSSKPSFFTDPIAVLLALTIQRYITRKDGSALMTSLPIWRETTLAQSKQISSALSDDEPPSSSDERVKRASVGSGRVRTTSSWVNWWRSSSSNNRASTSTNHEEESMAHNEESRPSSPQPISQAVSNLPCCLCLLVLK